MKMMEKISSATTYISSGIATCLGVMNLEEWAVAIGILVAIGNFLVNRNYKKRLLEIEMIKARHGITGHEDGAGT